MALRETELNGIHTDFDGTPIVQATIIITWDILLGYTSTHSIIQPPGGFPATTGDDGSYSLTLWAEETDSIVPNTTITYTAYFPRENNLSPFVVNGVSIALPSVIPDDVPRAKFSVVYSATPVSLLDRIALWAAANPSGSGED